MKMLKIFEKIYHFLSFSKNYLYDKKLVDSVRLQVPVVSIGNLSFGGVGKTPCIIMLAQEFTPTHKVCVVTRSYKADLKQAHRVDISLKDAAQKFGDEAVLIKSKLPGCEVWSGPNKAETAQQAMLSKPSLILVDDGFSHRKLERNFDLVLIDATQGLETYLRESEKNIKRAGAVIITKANLTNANTVDKIRFKILKIAPQLKDLIYVSSVKTVLKVDKLQPLFLFSGLARSESFVTDLKNQGYSIIHHEKFDDHHKYSGFEQKKLFAKYLDFKNQYRDIKLVTTEKDFVKLNNPDLQKNCIVTHHTMQMDESAKEALVAKIRTFF
ncbi:MAG: tetraacyldisaccharide 4'-kinase [Pseudobdellovibrio sp.]